mmetsp:Transcript_17573/g.33327  ORF Transcript_17573/g.33327 Transcript_17573/m.33327 type:complete len:304 (-) Transcript_17573:189-1100(-)
MHYEGHEDDNYYDATMISSPSFKGKSFNKRLDPTKLDIPEHDTSFGAGVIRKMTFFVSHILRPRQVIVLLRLLKALTFCTLCLTIISDLMFIFYVEISLSRDVGIKLGGLRDRVIRLYGTVLAFIAVLVELDMKVASTNFSGLKPFIIKSFMLFFVATISGASPMIGYERKLARQKNKNYNAYGYNNDDAYAYNQNNQQASHYIKDEVPGSAVAFQAITSFILAGCACAYLILGILCLDRFTARAFLADDDQVAAAISATTIVEPSRRRNSVDSYDNSGTQDVYPNQGTYSPNIRYNPERSRF